MQAGDFFLVSEIDDHWWIVISDPAQDSRSVVIVKLVSWHEKCDEACILRVGDHPFIRHDTSVDYPGAIIVSNDRLEELLRAGRMKIKEPASADLLAKIRRLAEIADVSTQVYDILREQGLVP